MPQSQKELQRQIFDAKYEGGSRSHVTTTDPMTRYIVSWRLKEAFRRLLAHPGVNLTQDCSVLFVCAGEGGEASLLCDLGYTNVTFSDLSPKGVEAGLTRDPRLKGIPLDAENLGLPPNSYDVVVAQDGLHHLPSPVRGFTEMLQVCRVAAIFIEPHNSLVGNMIGTKWEQNDGAVNYVFRWTKVLVEDVTSSLLGRDRFDNLSFAFWHHNMVYPKVGNLVGGGQAGIRLIAATKYVLDRFSPLKGNYFCGLIVKK